MPLTLDQARQKLYKYVSPTLDAAVVTDKINSALERIYNSGKWKGLMAPLYYNSMYDSSAWWGQTASPYITLPRHYQSIMGIQYNNIPRQVYPRWQEYIAGGAGTILAGTGMQMIIDMGDGFITNTDPTAPYCVRLEITDPQDVGKIVRISAVDQFGAQVFDSVGNGYLTAVLSLSGVTLPTVIAKITEIVKPITEGNVELIAVNPYSLDQASVIANYEATETIPSYKRYKAQGAEFTKQISCYCKRRFVPLVAGPDDKRVIVPDNEGALKLTLMALQYEDKNDLERADEYFQKALQLLNSELKEDMGAPVITLQMNPVAAAMRIPARY
jgi:hypothetical protein